MLLPVMAVDGLSVYPIHKSKSKTEGQRKLKIGRKVYDTGDL